MCIFICACIDIDIDVHVLRWHHSGSSWEFFLLKCARASGWIAVWLCVLHSSGSILTLPGSYFGVFDTSILVICEAPSFGLWFSVAILQNFYVRVLSLPRSSQINPGEVLRASHQSWNATHDLPSHSWKPIFKSAFDISKARTQNNWTTFCEHQLCESLTFSLGLCIESWEDQVIRRLATYSSVKWSTFHGETIFWVPHVGFQEWFGRSWVAFHDWCEARELLIAHTDPPPLLVPPKLRPWSDLFIERIWVRRERSARKFEKHGSNPLMIQQMWDLVLWQGGCSIESQEGGCSETSGWTNHRQKITSMSSEKKQIRWLREQPLQEGRC